MMIPLSFEIVQGFFRFEKAYASTGFIPLSCDYYLYYIKMMICSFQESSCAYVVIVMGIFWMTEILPLAVTALLPVILYPALGILDASEVSAVYLSVLHLFFKNFYLFLKKIF